MKRKRLYRYVLSGVGTLIMLAGFLTATGCSNDKIEASKKDYPFKRTFPETTERTRVFADQFPPISDLHKKQLEFIAKNYAGSQKMFKDFTTIIRKMNPNFLMLHYHLAIWQSYVDYVIDGENWGNDLDEVSKHDDWFMHRFNPETGEVFKGEENRVYAFDDHKYLMNITNEEYYQYFKKKLIKQCKAGLYDGVFLDSYHTAVLNFYLQNYPEYRGTSAGTGTYPELGKNVSWREASEKFMKRLTKDLNKAGIYSLPNLGNFATGWDTTDYTIANGGMTEGAFAYATLNDWKLGMNGHLKLISKDRIDMCQDSITSGDESYTERLYLLGNYLLLRGKYTYLNCLSDNTSFKYFPEYDLYLGKPKESAGDNIENLKTGGLYKREFQNGIVIVCPVGADPAEYTVPDGDYYRVVLHGRGDIDVNGTISGWLEFKPVSGSISLEPKTAEVIVNRPSVTSAYIPQLQSAISFVKNEGGIKEELATELDGKLSEAMEQLDNGNKKAARKLVQVCIKKLDENEKEIDDKYIVTLKVYAEALERDLGK